MSLVDTVRSRLNSSDEGADEGRTRHRRQATGRQELVPTGRPVQTRVVAGKTALRRWDDGGLDFLRG